MVNSNKLSSASIIVRTNNVMEAEIDTEIVALNVEKGICYGLNTVGSNIWRMLASPIRVADICAALVAEYAVEPAICERDVLDVLENFLAEGMIVTQPDETDRVAAGAAGA